jgi:hypothetical protein
VGYKKVDLKVAISLKWGAGCKKVDLEVAISLKWGARKSI